MRIAELAAGLATPALFLVPGLGISRLVPEIWRLRILRRLAFSFLLGIAWLAASFYMLSYLFGIGLNRATIAGLVAIPVIAGCVAHARARKLPSARGSSGRRGPAWIPLVGVVIGILYLSLLAGAIAYPVLDFDGRMTWSTNARFVRAEGSVLPRVLREPQWFVSHPSYPLLMPIAQAMSLEAFGGAEDAFFFRALYATMYPALLLVLYEGARRRAGARAAILTVSTAALLPYLAFVIDGGAAGAYSDVPLAAFFGAALVLLLRRGGPASGAAAGLLLAAAVLSKREGTILALGAIGAGVLECAVGGGAPAPAERLSGSGLPRRLPSPRWVSSCLGGARWLPAATRTISRCCGPPRPALWSARRFRWGRAACPTIAREMLDPSQWSLLWWIAPVILAAGCPRVAAPAVGAGAACRFVAARRGHCGVPDESPGLGVCQRHLESLPGAGGAAFLLDLGGSAEGSHVGRHAAPRPPVPELQ